MEASSSSAIAQLFQRDKPNDPCYFKRVKIHSLALLKMVIHARSGGTMEVIGLMQGETDGDCITVRDAIALSVEGTETRVNAQADAQTNKQVPAGRLEDVVGWYHSHPGYGCWLSGIDVSTQMVNQQFQESFLAVVIDPTRTHPDDGEVDLEAFMTYPEDYKPPDDFENQLIPLHIPLNKIRDFDDHCKQYYSLLITYFRSHSDTQLLQPLWENCWREAQSSCLLLQGDYLAGQISALAKHPKALSRFKPPRKKEEESPLTKIPRDSAKQVHVLMSQVIKDTLISSVHQANKSLHIPEAIVEQILFKLSIKVLCKLKVVSKGLYSLISSPEFGHNLISATFLFYVHNESSMYIWNPAIRKTGKLKFSVDPEDEKRSLGSRQYDFNLTFGFHPHKKEYVLFAVRVAAGRNPDPHKEIFVFYLGNDRCDKLGDLPYDGQVMMRNGILAKENVYRCIKSGDIYYVVSYGLVLKEYSQITLPFDLADFQFLGQLYKLKDSLAVFSRHRQPEYTDFWLLDANNKDWTPLCRIELAVIYSPVYMYDNVLLAHIRSSGGNGYLVYNVESNLQLKFSLAEHIDSDGFFKSPVKIYHESLVWPLYSKVVKAIYKAESSLEGPAGNYSEDIPIDDVDDDDDEGLPTVDGVETQT